MRVLFLWANFDCPIGISIGVSYISSYLKKNGHQVNALHINERLGVPFDEKLIIDRVREYSPDVVIASFGENHYSEMRSIGEKIKKEFDVVLGFGGVHCTLNADQVIEENSFLDYVFIHDGEVAIPKVVNSLQTKIFATNIENTYCRLKTTIFKNNLQKKYEIEKLEPMDLDIWDFEKVTELRRGWVNVSFNRGCPYRCSFCHNEGVTKVLQKNIKAINNSNSTLNYLRYRDVDDMILELKSIKDKYPFVKAFSFIDDTFTMNKQQIIDFLVKYEKEINLPFVCNTTAMDVNEEILTLLKDANCSLIRFGVETATDRIKKTIIKRSFPNSKLQEVFKFCKKIELKCFSYNMIAHPTETKEEILDTFKLNAELKPDGIRVSLGYPYPGTEYYKIASDLDMLDDSVSSHNYSTASKFKWNDSMRLWIDKCNVLYWWYVNSKFSEICSDVYSPLITFVEQLDKDKWENIKSNGLLQDLDESVSTYLSNKKIEHYTVAFKDRPDIALLKSYDKCLDKELLDQH